MQIQKLWIFMMAILKYNFMRASILLALILCHLPAFGQDTSNGLFAGYWKVGFSSNRTSYFAKNEPNSVDYKLYNQNMFNVGLVWDFYQKGNHNFKVSILKNIKNWESAYLRIKAEDVPFPEDTPDYSEITSIRSTNYQWKANVLYEYFVRLNNKIYLSGAVGPEFLYYPAIREGGALGIGWNEDGETILIRVKEQTERVKNINPGIKEEISIYFSTEKVGLFQLKVGGFWGFNDYQITKVHAFNLAVSPESYSTHTIKGYYWDFGISYYLPKKKKNKN